MRRAFGIFSLLLGFCCLLSAVGLVIYNRSTEERASYASDQLLSDVKEKMIECPSEENEDEVQTMQVDEYDCIGVLSIPVLELELPVLTDWSYEKLKVAPCHYYGTYYDKDFTIAAHNYPSHFGKLSQLETGDLILFTDVSGTVRCYEVVLLETLPGNATEAMITSGFDLSLYTCTPGGSNRVTVRCNLMTTG